MDLGKKLPRDKLCRSDGLRFLFGLLQIEIGTSDMPTRARRFAELVRDRRKEGVPAETYMEAFEAKIREIRQDGFIEVDEKLAGTLLNIGLELTHQEPPNITTAIDAQKGYEAFGIQKVTDAVRRVAVPPKAWGGGKPGSPQWEYCDVDRGSQDWNWEADWVNWTDDCGGAHGEGEEYWDDSYEAYRGYTQCKKCLGRGHWGGECPKYPFTDEKWGWRGKGRNAEKREVRKKRK